MRASFVFSEVVTGLRRNVTMTVAMIITTAISLGLLGGGLLIVRLIDKMSDIYYDRVEVAVFLTEDVSTNDAACTQQPCTDLRRDLEGTPGVESVVLETREQAYERFRQIFESQPELVELARPQALPASFRVKLEDPERFPVIEQEFRERPGVLSVKDQGTFLERLFELLNGIRNATFAIAVVQALAAVLLISNTIQVSAYTRRTEVGIMRLVGATRWYTQLPFLIEAVVAGMIGAIVAVIGLVVAKFAFLDKILAAPIEANIIPRLGLLDVAVVSPILLLVAVGISSITGYVTLRLYVRL
ncbi:MAG TPA: permease-like cell division protein FtsX [Pseudonocardiaceae bacterium]